MSKEITIIIEDDAKALALLDAVCKRFAYDDYIIAMQKKVPSFNITKANFVKLKIKEFLISSAINGQQKLDYKAMALGYESLIIN